MSLSTYIHVDDSLWPLLVIRHGGSPTNKQFEELLALRTSYLDRGPHVTVSDMSEVLGLGTLEQRNRQVEWLKQHDARLRDVSLGMAFVTSSTEMKLLLSVILHLKPLTSPHATFKHLSEAMAWSADCLARSGLAAEARHVREHLGAFPGRRSA